MINWIVGGGIIALAIYIIIRKVNQMRKGQNDCCSSGCGCSDTSAKCGCSK